MSGNIVIDIELCKEDRELIDNLIAGLAGLAAVVVAQSKDSVKDDEKTDDTDAAKAKALAAKTAVKKAKEAEKAAADIDGDVITVDTIRDALRAYATKHGKPAAVKILTDHGAASIAELDADKFADVIEAATKAPPTDDEDL